MTVTAEYSKYRGRRGEVLSFTPSGKSVRVQLGGQVVTVRVRSVQVQPIAVEEALISLAVEIEKLKKAVKRLEKQL